MLGSFFVCFFAEHFGAGNFLKRGVGGFVFSAETSLFSPGVFGFLLMKKADWFR